MYEMIICRLYDSKSEAEGKAAAKAELRKHMSLSSTDVPLVGVVTRLTHQKGIHLIKHAAWRTLERGGQFVLLGSAPDPRVQVLTLNPSLPLLFVFDASPRPLFLKQQHLIPDLFNDH